MTLTADRYEQSMSAPPLCEQLRIRDLLDDVAVQVDGSFVAGFEVGGIQSYYASDEGRNRLKGLFEALVRSLPERSLRMQVRFEISEGSGDLVSRYVRERQSESERFHPQLPQAKTGVLLMVETATAPPSTASANAQAINNLFIIVLLHLPRDFSPLGI